MTRITGERRTKHLRRIGIVLLVMGLIILLGAVKLFFQSSASSRWSSELGVVTVSETTTGNALLVYSYTVHGVRYENNRRSFFSEGAIESPDYAEEVVQQYPVGKEVTVYYNPDDPSDAVLEPGSVVPIIVPIIIGFFVCGFASIPLLVVRAERKKAEAAA